MKKKPCRCCDGTGEEYDDISVGAEMRALRLKSNLTLEEMGSKMKRRFSQAYLSDLEHGRRGWSDRLIAEYRRVCS